ncbi:MAG: LPS export ABC transporter periplasmic protein LptC [Holosporales bacterium]
MEKPSSPLHSKKQSFHRSTRHSKRVARLKVILPVAAAVGLISLGLWPLAQNYIESAQQRKNPQPKFDVTIQNKLVNPESITLDDKGRPVKLNADLAEQSNNDKVDLSKPTNEIQLEDGTQVKIKSERGTIDRTTDTLTYEGGVQVETSSGYTLETPSATLNLKSHIAEGREPVKAKGPAGEVEGEGFSVDRDKGLLTIKGKSRLVINPQEKRSKPHD